MKLDKDADSNDASVEFGFRFGSYAAINPDENDIACGNAGVGFNPLLAKDQMGRALKYQDPGRGNLDNVTFDADGSSEA